MWKGSSQIVKPEIQIVKDDAGSHGKNLKLDVALCVGSSGSWIVNRDEPLSADLDFGSSGKKEAYLTDSS